MIKTGIGLLLMIAACAAQPEPGPEPAAAPKADGAWILVAMDGRPLPGAYTVEVKDGRVAGGRDGCNMWGWDSAGPGGDRAIHSTLIGCPETQQNRTYWAVARDEQARLAVSADGRLAIEGAGHRLIGRRVGLADKAGWTVTEIDGAPVPVGYILNIEAGRITGGRDGCNGWRRQADGRPAYDQSFPTDPPCTEAPKRRSYWAAVDDRNRRMGVRPDGMLVVEGGGHILVASPMAAGAEPPAAPPAG